TLGAAWCGALAIVLVWQIELHYALKALLVIGFLAVGGVAGFVLLRILPRERTETGAAIRLLGVRITPVSMDAALDRARDFIAEGSPHIIVTSDASGMIRAREDAELREIMDEADLVTADGQGVVLAARLLNVPIRERVSGVDMVQRLCELATEAGHSVFLLGGAEGVAEAAGESLKAAVPGLRIAGVQHGYFAPDEEAGIIDRIRRAQPAVLFVAFGIPRQEKWIRAHMDELGVPVCIGVGGSFDVISGRLKRAPAWMRRCGLEWLYRVIQEPRRLPRLKALPQIAWVAVIAALKGEAGEYVE
ncbi:MAG: WecB/TagA/CpsF family glycosyltransferase, partial [Armatimonadetes bacterium]|nr:WecB/TagA/CpsF family glycosyltransferase [Armatimonadota bacterium]